ncbi:MAG: PaaI family thioesterase [Alphaproteobacteria bacterium]|nr:MAG: PaaI family thioesterase [Alphaproteobacteria bacterium]
MQPVMTAADLHDFMAREFPQMHDRFEVVGLGPFRASVRMEAREADLRPGGTVSGPAMFALADCAFYLATLAMIGPRGLAVTTSCAIDFMRKPAPGGLRADARILKLGRSLSVGDVTLFSDGMDAPVAHANVTYSLPPRG